MTQLFPFFLFVYSTANATMPLSKSHSLEVTLWKPLSRSFFSDFLNIMPTLQCHFLEIRNYGCQLVELVASCCIQCKYRPWKKQQSNGAAGGEAAVKLHTYVAAG